MWRPRDKKLLMSADRAEEIAANALAFLAADAARMMQFLETTGVSLDDLRRDAGSPRMLTAVLDHLVQDESLLLVFTSSIGLPPEDIGPARDMLANERPQTAE
jgi:lambda repressor-like predicted transcriptional regulator